MNTEDYQPQGTRFRVYHRYCGFGPYICLSARIHLLPLHSRFPIYFNRTFASPKSDNIWYAQLVSLAPSFLAARLYQSRIRASPSYEHPRSRQSPHIPSRMRPGWQLSKPRRGHELPGGQRDRRHTHAVKR